jgi:hypothetical protein
MGYSFVNNRLVVTFVDKHLASVEDGGLKAVKYYYINNDTSFWQGNISTKFIGKGEVLKNFSH